MSEAPGFKENCMFCKIAQKIQRKSYYDKFYDKSGFSRHKNSEKSEKILNPRNSTKLLNSRVKI